ncbi:VOC family protein [Sagittula sp. SSi028]|uniref:VOC family protein n=1 Tax=Sagittula sp. SSi028 TaxID=3400636 RepID=UPI003AF99FC1
MKLAYFAFLVPEYDEGIAFFSKALGFELLEDTDMGGGKRWVRVASPSGESVLLARATGAQRDAIGQQGGGRVWLFLHSDDFAADHARLTEHGATFEESPRHEPYGTVAVFRDPWGNRWDLIQPAGQ